MKTLFVLVLTFSTLAHANWTETFKLPEGMTYRARTAGFDCGKFGNTYVSKPARFDQIDFKQLAADNKLNKFLIEAEFLGSKDKKCIYGAFLDRNRNLKTLDFTHSLIHTEGDVRDCSEIQSFLDQQMSSMMYEGSKRGLRYIATQIITNETNEVCSSGNVRVVFDRRYKE
jgi:hypothetical protein